MKKKRATDKKSTHAELELHMDDIEDTMSIMHVTQDGYSATFEDEAQRKLVAHLLAKVDGYARTIRALVELTERMR